MSQQNLVDIANASTRILGVEAMRQRFMVQAAASGNPNNINAQFQANGNELAVSWNGLTAKAVGRTVRASDGSFRIEYVFRVPIGDESIEVTRLYLNDGGKLWEDVDESRPVCDFDNSYLSGHVCGRVILGMLSHVFTPTPQ